MTLAMAISLVVLERRARAGHVQTGWDNED